MNSIDRDQAPLDHAACYEAVKRRDARFDGRFFTAVTTTGIFCRPSCPARTPRSTNVRFYAHAAAAGDAGFRPCRRCRPELAPDHPEWNRRADLAGRAMSLISRGVVDQQGVAGLANQLGVSERHLRRELLAEVGTGPLQLARTRRLGLARMLLDQTNLSITDIAFASGFGSVRQFNETFRQAYEATPSELRRRPDTASSGATEVSLRLAGRGPVGWADLRTFLTARAIDGLEAATPTGFRRGVPGGWIELEGDADDGALILHCRLDRLDRLADLVPIVRSLADLDSDRQAVADHLSADPDLSARLDRRPLPPLPGTFDPFELAVRAVVGQQVSVAGASTTLGRLVELARPRPAADATPDAATGPAPEDGSIRHHGFPSPDEVAAAPLDQLGMPAKRRATIATLARAVADGRLDLSPAADREEQLAKLLELPGIGPWTAGYIAMRALGDPDGWPSGDLILRRSLARGPLGQLDDDTIDARQLDARAERWRPWRGYAALLLWATSRDGAEDPVPDPTTDPDSPTDSANREAS